MVRRIPLCLVLAMACGKEPAAGDDGGGSGGSADDGSGSSDGPGDGDGMPTSGSGSGGMDDNADGMTGDGSESGDDTGVPPGPAPIIPDVDGECPDFTDGMQMIGDLDTLVVAGDPANGPGPLLLYWHGTGSNPGVEVPGLLPAEQRAEIMEQGGLIIAPQSNGEDRGGFSPNGVWYEGTDGEGGDLAWVDQVVACAVANHNIDPRRIYTTGCSAGGLMTAGVALKRSNYIAAGTPNSGGIVLGGTELLQDPERVPYMMTMNGGNNDTVIVNFGATSAALDDVIVEAGGFAIDCNHMIGHCQAPADLRSAAWVFMKDHPYGTQPPPYADGLPDVFPGYCEIW